MFMSLTAANDEYQQLLTEDELLADNQWFREQDEREFIAEANFTEQSLKMEYDANRMEMVEKLAKDKARAKVLDLFGIPPLEAEEDVK